MKLLMMSLLAIALVGCVKGPKGDRGDSGKIVSTLNCSGEVSGTGYANLDGLHVEYDAVLTAVGDVYATAVVYDDSYQASGTAFYAANQNGAMNAQVYVTADYIGATNGGLWDISLDRSTLITSVRYEDADVIGGSVDMTFTPSACTVQYW